MSTYIVNPITRLRDIFYSILQDDGVQPNIQALQTLKIGDANGAVNIGTVNQFQNVISVTVRKDAVYGLQVLEALRDRNPEIDQDMRVLELPAPEKECKVCKDKSIDLFDNILKEVDRVGGIDAFKEYVCIELADRLENKTHAARRLGVSVRSIRGYHKK